MKMVNTKVKGNYIQRKLITRLEHDKHLVAKVEQGGKFAKVKDMFGLFDLVAIREDVISFIQVTCNRPHSHKPYLKFSKKYKFQGLYYMQYIWYDRRGWKIFEYYRGKMEIYDERKR